MGIRDGTVAGVEALLRWTHPVHGAVPALTAVAVAERSHQIDGLGAWVLERSCTEHGRWMAEHPGRVLDLSVNVSVRQLMNPSFSATVSRILRETNMDPAALVLEVTEGIFIEDDTPAIGALAALRALGVRLALDDFGTGYCSLGYLGRLPVDIVKIAQRFVADIGRHPSGAAIAAAISDVSHILGLGVTAEGVETEEQHAAVAGTGCGSAQEHLYGRPMSGSAVPALLRDGLAARGVATVPLHPWGRAAGALPRPATNAPAG